MTVEQLAGHRHRRRDRRRRRGRRDDGRADAEHRPQRRLDRRPERLHLRRHARAPQRAPDRRRSRCSRSAVGLACGLVNGLLVAVGADPGDHRDARRRSRSTAASSFEITGGAATSLRTSSRTAFLDLAAKKPLGLPSLAWIALGVALVGGAVLRWAPWGRDFYAIGSNPDAARLAGIPVGRRVITAFAISGALAGLGGFMFAARFANVDADSPGRASSSTSSRPS